MIDASGTRRCIDVISGTSADGIDATLVRITGAGATAHLDLFHFLSVPNPDLVRQELLALSEPAALDAISPIEEGGIGGERSAISH